MSPVEVVETVRWRTSGSSSNFTLTAFVVSIPQALGILELKTAQVVQELGILIDGPAEGAAGGTDGLPNGNGGGWNQADDGGMYEGYGGAPGMNGGGGAGGRPAYAY